MCRLFGMSAGAEPMTATFWLLRAPDSLVDQSHREPDGTGLGYYDAEGHPLIDKQPLAAFDDQEFARAARTVRSRTFVGHIRYASNGALTQQNTHPFEQRGRLFAHNGVIGELGSLEQQLGDAAGLLRGETDSERWFALITDQIARHGGDVGEAIAVATRWVAANLPVLSLNFVLLTATELWALRYPETHELHVLERPAGGTGPAAAPSPLDDVSSHGTRIHAKPGAERPAVVLASEIMDGDPAWRELASGELLHVDAALSVRSRTVIDRPPARPLALSDLPPRARSSQS
ncbi:MAG: class II glutamine amidotransferase [Solirubrobacteraceae bacterium]